MVWRISLLILAKHRAEVSSENGTSLELLMHTNPRYTPPFCHNSRNIQWDQVRWDYHEAHFMHIPGWYPILTLGIKAQSDLPPKVAEPSIGWQILDGAMDSKNWSIKRQHESQRPSARSPEFILGSKEIEVTLSFSNLDKSGTTLFHNYLFNGLFVIKPCATLFWATGTTMGIEVIIARWGTQCITRSLSNERSVPVDNCIYWTAMAKRRL